MKSVKDAFDLTGRVAVITGGAGLLGKKHAEAICEMGGNIVLLDVDGKQTKARAKETALAYGVDGIGIACDITRPEAVRRVLKSVLSEFGRVDILINNAANNPKVEGGSQDEQWTRLENFPLEVWNQDMAVGLTGAFICSQVIGSEMAFRHNGVILNIASDLSIIAPDQRIYRKPDLTDKQQPVKPVSYSVVKSGLVGLTRYLATYWAESGVRVNAMSPGGVFNNQDIAFVRRLIELIPMRRMANVDEYKAAVIFLVSDASSYMTGANLVIDGGRTCW